MRPSFNEIFLNMVDVVSKRSTCVHQQIAAILVRENRPIAMGYNGRASGDPHCCDIGQCYREERGASRDFKICLHAEQNALMFACANGINTAGTTLYVNTDPCITCAKLLVQAKVEQVVIRYQPGVRHYQDGLDYLYDHNVEVIKMTGDGQEK